MASYYGPFAQLEDLGLLDVILPFILIFTLVFAFLQKSKILGKDSKRFNAVVALVMGLSVVFPHVLGYYPPERDIVNIINQSLPNVGVIVVAIVMALIIIGLMGKQFKLGAGSASGWIAIIAFGAVVYIFGDAANWWESPAWLYFLRDSETMMLVVAVLIFAIIIWFITKGSPDEEARKKRVEYLVKTYGGKPENYGPIVNQIGHMLQDPPKKEG